MISKSPMTSLPLFALAGFLAACAPREDALDQDAVEDTVAADEAGGSSTLLFVPAEDA